MPPKEGGGHGLVGGKTKARHKAKALLSALTVKPTEVFFTQAMGFATFTDGRWVAQTMRELASGRAARAVHLPASLQSLPAAQVALPRSSLHNYRLPRLIFTRSPRSSKPEALSSGAARGWCYGPVAWRVAPGRPAAAAVRADPRRHGRARRPLSAPLVISTRPSSSFEWFHRVSQFQGPQPDRCSCDGWELSGKGDAMPGPTRRPPVVHGQPPPVVLPPVRQHHAHPGRAGKAPSVESHLGKCPLLCN